MLGSKLHLNQGVGEVVVNLFSCRVDVINTVERELLGRLRLCVRLEDGAQPSALFHLDHYLKQATDEATRTSQSYRCRHTLHLSLFSLSFMGRQRTTTLTASAIFTACSNQELLKIFHQHLFKVSCQSNKTLDSGATLPAEPEGKRLFIYIFDQKTEKNFKKTFNFHKLF